MAEFESLEGEDDWDDDLAEELIGSSLLVGLTFLDADGQVVSLQQIFGTVEKCDRDDGITIRVHQNDELVTIAPILEAVDYGGTGIYQLADSDEVVENPDFTALMTVTHPRRH